MQNQLERKEDEEEEAKYAVIEMFECHSFINKLNKDYIFDQFICPYWLEPQALLVLFDDSLHI